MTTTTANRTTIVLTNRPPVRIDVAAWPIVASASYTEHDSRHPTQVNRQWRGSIRVRQHADGRTIVYATCAFATSVPTERSYERHAGELLPAGITSVDLVAAIRRAHLQVAPDPTDPDYRWWAGLADACIAGLPPEDL